MASRSYSPPVGGWDTRDALADMPGENAVILDNYFPDTDSVELRLGHASHATGLSGAVETLIEYVPETGTGELFAANGGAIYDVSSAGAVGAAEASGFTNDRWQFTQIGTAGGHFVFCVNGADTPQVYNGTSWSNTTLTGPTVANLAWCTLHHRRLFFGEASKLSFWYLDVNSITGAASEFPLNAVAKRGGYIMAMGSWSRDAGDGQDDLAVFITSEGEAIVYQGTNPNNETTWALVGVFRIGAPIGRRCLTEYGGDLVIITEDGFIALNAVLTFDRAEAAGKAVSAQIRKAVADAAREHGSLFGWEPIIYTKGSQILFNVPQSTTVFHQYVFNTITGKPCRYKGMNATCWGLLDDELYFGGTDGVVYKGLTGNTDNGSAIVGDILPAFRYFGTKQAIKNFQMFEPVFQSNDDPAPAIDLNVDFQVRAPTGVSTPTSTVFARWGVAKWGTGIWGTSNLVFRGWRGLRGTGRVGSVRVRTSTTVARPKLIAMNYVYDVGGAI